LIVKPGITALELSVTVPVTTAKKPACPKLEAAKARINNGIAPRLKTIFIFPPEEEALNRSKAANLVSRTPHVSGEEP
jgi:hypothetical protein